MLVSVSDSTAPNKGATKDSDSRNDTDSSGLPNTMATLMLVNGSTFPF